MDRYAYTFEIYRLWSCHEADYGVDDKDNDKAAIKQLAAELSGVFYDLPKTEIEVVSREPVDDDCFMYLIRLVLTRVGEERLRTIIRAQQEDKGRKMPAEFEALDYDGPAMSMVSEMLEMVENEGGLAGAHWLTSREKLDNYEEE